MRFGKSGGEVACFRYISGNSRFPHNHINHQCDITLTVNCVHSYCSSPYLYYCLCKLSASWCRTFTSSSVNKTATDTTGTLDLLTLKSCFNFGFTSMEMSTNSFTCETMSVTVGPSPGIHSGLQMFCVQFLLHTRWSHSAHTTSQKESWLPKKYQEGLCSSPCACWAFTSKSQSCFLQWKHARVRWWHLQTMPRSEVHTQVSTSKLLWPHKHVQIKEKIPFLLQRTVFFFLFFLVFSKQYCKVTLFWSWWCHRGKHVLHWCTGAVLSWHL